MTALAGFWSERGREDPARACERILGGQSIYGRHSALLSLEGGVALGRRLFPLVPEDSLDRAPSLSGDGSSMLVADIRLDNRSDLGSALCLGEAELRTLSDAALLLTTLIRWDVGALDRLVGDFAFAWWDGRRRRLLLARDYVGTRPLHFHRGDGFLALASMPKGLHALPDIPKAPSPAAAAEFLALLPEAAGGSFYEGIESVPPGHYIECFGTHVRAVRYWNPDLTPLRLGNAGEYEEALREQLDKAVAARLRGSGGTVGSHLSAGVDSSSVTATAARLAAQHGGKVVAYTAVPRQGYDGPAPRNVIADEGPAAAAVAALYPNVEHVTVTGSDMSPLDGLDRHFFLYDRPVLNPCNFTWTDAINEAAKARQIRVMLWAQFGNIGFSYHGMTLLPALLKRGRLLSLSKQALHLVRNGVRAGTVGAQAVGPFVPRSIWQAISRLRGRGSGLFDHSCIDEAAAEALDLAGRATERGLDFGYRPRADGLALRLWVLRRVDIGNYVKGMLAGWGVDMRDPTADRRFMEFCLRVPEEQYLGSGLPRSLARRAMADRLPPLLLNARAKGYQGVDWHEGLSAARPALREEIGRIAALPDTLRILDTKRMTRLVDQWPEGGWETPRIVEQYRLALLRGAAVGHFLRRAAGSNA